MLFKKIIAVALAMAMSLSVLASCGKIESDDDKNESSSISANAEKTDDIDDEDDDDRDSGDKISKKITVGGGVAAAILIPAFIGYVKDSKLASANSSAKTVYTALNNYCQKCLTYEEPVSDGIYSGTVTYTTTELSLAYNGTAADMGNAVSNSLNKDADGSQWEVKIQNGFPISVTWKKDPSDPYVGRYPNAAYDKNAVLE